MKLLHYFLCICNIYDAFTRLSVIILFEDYANLIVWVVIFTA